MKVDLVLRLLEERDTYRDALNCKACAGMGKKPIGLDVRVDISPAGETKIAWHWEPCPDCLDAREKARSDGK